MVNASVLGQATDAKGWYRLDFYGGACSGCGACGTAILQIDAPGYKPFSEVLGRGVSGVLRFDVHLEPR